MSMNLYKNMLPKQLKPGKKGYYPVTNKEEWDELPDLYKVMEWKPVNDPFSKGELKAVKAVIFDVVFLQPYGIRAKVSVHPQEIQKILFCSYKKYDCHLYSVCGIELDGGSRLPAKWLQDSISGAFAISACGDCVGVQGGFRGYIPEGIQCMEDGTFKYDFRHENNKISHYVLCNPFDHLPEEYVWGAKGDTSVNKDSLHEKIESVSTRVTKSFSTSNTPVKEAEPTL